MFRNLKSLRVRKVVVHLLKATNYPCRFWESVLKSLTHTHTSAAKGRIFTLSLINAINNLYQVGPGFIAK